MFKRYEIPKIAINNPIVGRVHLDAICRDDDNHDVLIFASEYKTDRDNFADNMKQKHWYYSFRDQVWSYGAHPRFSYYDNPKLLLPDEDKTVEDFAAIKFLNFEDGTDGRFNGLFVERFISALLNEHLSNDQMTKGLKSHLPYVEKATRNYLGYWTVKIRTKTNGVRVVTPAQLMLWNWDDVRPTD